TRPALRATGTKSALTRLITSGLEKTASRTAPANTQQRASSMGRSIKTQSKTGLFLARDSLSPSSKQLFQTIARQATLDDFRDSISAFRASGVAGFSLATGDGWAQARPVNSTQYTTTVGLRMVSLLLSDGAAGLPRSGVDQRTKRFAVRQSAAPPDLRPASLMTRGSVPGILPGSPDAGPARS